MDGLTKAFWQHCYACGVSLAENAANDVIACTINRTTSCKLLRNSFHCRQRINRDLCCFHVQDKRPKCVWKYLILKLHAVYYYLAMSSRALYWFRFAFLKSSS
jgi:hypothetical protein